MRRNFLLILAMVISCYLWGQTIMIETLDDLIALSTNNAVQGGYEGQTIELTSDIEINKLWFPIGTAEHPFQGIFNGNEHVISGLGAITSTDGVGLFGYVGFLGQINNLGIGTGHIKTMKEDKCQYIGSLVGRNYGKILGCWNMATIKVKGSCVGGLIGQNEGLIENCYNAGPILEATDSIGGLVGINTGEINHCYNIGFVRNGYGFVGHNKGIITDCHYDRQLYIQNPSPEYKDPDGVIAEEKTQQMFGLFRGNAIWTTSTDNYPMLTAFINHDAAKVSIASIDLDVVTEKEKENHMNALEDIFRVNSKNGVTWSVDASTEQEWIFLDPYQENVWNIEHPCRPTEVIMHVSLNDHVREVYAFPVPIPDFYAGKIEANQQQVCIHDTLYFKDINFASNIDPTGGRPNYRVLLLLKWYDEGHNRLCTDTLINATSWEEYQSAFASGCWSPNRPGQYEIVRYAADSQCHTDYVKSDGSILVLVPDSLFAGQIAYFGEDTLCYSGETKTITIHNKETATSKGATVLYFWLNGEDTIPNATESSLMYNLTHAGTYIFRRYTYNNVCVDKTQAISAPTEVKIIVLDEFEPGFINNGDTTVITSCSVEDALAQMSMITGSEASGGGGSYVYQWDIENDGSILAIDEENGYKNAICGEKGTDLDLRKIGMKVGNKYIFTRSVYDERCMEQVQKRYSKGQVIIAIYSDVQPGQIETKTIDSTCIQRSKTDKIDISIGSISAASTNSGEVAYHWYRVLNQDTLALIGENQSTLKHTISLPEQMIGETTYLFYRTSYNSSCSSNEVQDEGITTINISYAEESQQNVNLCEAQFIDGQYTFFYPNNEEARFTHIFYLDHLEAWHFRDSINEDCLPFITITPTIISSPSITTDSIVEICQDGVDGTLTLYFQMMTGSADMYHIELNEGLQNYFDNKTFISDTMPLVQVGEVGVITLHCKRIDFLGEEKVMFLQVGRLSDNEEQPSCLSSKQKITLTITQEGYIHSKYDKILFIDNNPNKENDIKFTAFQWYKNQQPIIGATRQYYDENGAILRGNYYADLTYIENGKEVILRTCTVHMPMEDEQKSSRPTPNASKLLENGSIIIQRGEMKYDLLGIRI